MDAWRRSSSLWLNSAIKPFLLFLRLLLNPVKFSARFHLFVSFGHGFPWTSLGVVLEAFSLAGAAGGSGPPRCSECPSSDFYPQQLLIGTAESQ